MLDELLYGNFLSKITPFDQSLKSNDLFPLVSTGITNLQINMGKMCNQACGHCHVNAGPNRKEMMTKDTMQKCLDIIRNSKIDTVDLTGGSPELNPHFRWFVKELKESNTHNLVRTNLTVAMEDGQEDLPDFYRDNGIELVASMPCYLEENVDRQRGKGVHAKSIKVLRKLNGLGYGVENSGLVLNLVYNPGGSALPPDQSQLEQDYKRELKEKHDVVFNNLFTITNMPIGRFHRELKNSGQLDDYMKLLANSFNPHAAENVMCLYTLSVGWEGFLYDCDFNQMLDMRCNHGAPDNVNDFNLEKLDKRRIVTGIHCYGCTAGAGSSCHGVTANN
jgi:radical SAM/Cys-rich protein